MKIFKNIKIWIIVALITVLLGAIFIAVFGLNNTPDYKAAYEVSVSVDQNIEGSGELVKKTAEKYFNEKGYKYSPYATQITEDGATYIYKFNKAGDVSESELKGKLEDALTADADLNGLGLTVNALYKKTATTADVNAGMVILACALSLLAAFIIALFMVKLASATTIIINAVLSAIIYISLISITRIPAMPDFAIGGAIAVILSAVMTFVIACRYKETFKLNDKADVKAVAESGVKEGLLRLCFIAAAGIFAAIALSATGSIYLLFTGLKVLVATVSAFLVSVVSTPVLFSTLKNVKAKK